MSADGQGDTTLGGPGRDFPRTTEGFLGALGGSRGLEELCRRYWKPVYSFLRAGLARPNEDAKDCTQDFFAWLLDGGVVERYDPRRAPFRAYLKGVLRRFVKERDRDAGRLKRGGGRTFVSFSDDDLGLAGTVGAPDPEQALDQAWLVEVLRRAVEELRTRCEAGGRSTAFRVLEETDLRREGEAPSYASLAARHGLTENQVRNALSGLRKELREAAAAEIAAQTGSREQFEEEWRVFLGT